MGKKTDEIKHFIPSGEGVSVPLMPERIIILKDGAKKEK